MRIIEDGQPKELSANAEIEKIAGDVTIATSAMAKLTNANAETKRKIGDATNATKTSG